MMNSRERRLSLWSNATCAMPLCEALSSCRGLAGHITRKRIASEAGISRDWPSALSERDGPHREGEEL